MGRKTYIKVMKTFGNLKGKIVSGFGKQVNYVNLGKMTKALGRFSLLKKEKACYGMLKKITEVCGKL